MKNLIYALSFLLSIVLAGCGGSDQDQGSKEQKPEENYVLEYGKDYFYAKNGMDERVKVKVGVARSDIVPNDSLGNVAMSSVIKCMYKAKNKNSYIPREFSLFDDNKDIATIIVKWLGTNAYGAQGEESCYYKWDSEGGVQDLF